MSYYDVSRFGAIGDGKADDTKAIQEALDTAKADHGGTVYVPKGRYAITDILKIYSRTKLILDPAAVILRQAATSAMLINVTNGMGGYEGGRSIEITGGTWDGNMEANDTRFTAIAIAHARDITIHHTRILNIKDWHAVELNGVEGAEVSHCHFAGFRLTRKWSEAIQLDLMISEATFPWFGPWDNTPCRNIRIEGCTFTGGWDRGIGTHSQVEGVDHEYIRIVGNHFDSLSGEGIEGLRYRYVTISHNTFTTVYDGMKMTDCHDMAISGNTFDNPRQHGIVFSGGSGRSAITGNVIMKSGQYGVRLEEGSRWNTVVGNVIRDSGKQGFSVQDADSNIVENNIVDD